MNALRTRPVDRGIARAAELRRRFGADLRTTRVGAGMTQRDVGRRAGVSQSFVSQVERAAVEAPVDAMARLSAAVGGELALRIYPSEGVSLRDSGQLEVADLIRREAHPRWRVAYEVPVAPPPDRRAGDMFLDQTQEAVLLEIERGLTDFQAQFRSAQLKRGALGERLGRQVRLVLVLLDTDRARRAVAAHGDVIDQALPIPTRQVLAAIRSGVPIGGDGVLWVRPRHLRAGRRHTRTIPGPVD